MFLYVIVFVTLGLFFVIEIVEILFGVFDLEEVVRKVKVEEKLI